jgi:hypothetical protein
MSGHVLSKVPPTEIATENLEPQDTHYTNDENQIDSSTEMFVCPINAPDQTPYIPSTIHQISIAAVALHERRCCAWFPACKMKQNICGGSRSRRKEVIKNLSKVIRQKRNYMIWRGRN